MPYELKVLIVDGNPPTLERVEREYIVYLLEQAGGNRTQVARWIGVSYPTIMKKIRDYRIDLSRWPRRGVRLTTMPPTTGRGRERMPSATLPGEAGRRR